MFLSEILYLVGILIAIISIVISFSVKSRFNKWSKDDNMRHITGKEAAERILHHAGVYDVGINCIDGTLSDHYNPKDKTLNLSKDVYEKATIASVAVAAHEVGHAIQHNKAYAPLSVRTAIAPVVSISSSASIYIVLAGAIFAIPFLIDIGIIMFATYALFAFITLPVEFNASNRAMSHLRELNILADSEMRGARSVLSAAAMTYVAAAAAAIVQLLRLTLLRKRD